MFNNMYNILLNIKKAIIRRNHVCNYFKATTCLFQIPIANSYCPNEQVIRLKYAQIYWAE